MAYRTLELTLISAKDLKDVNFFSRMEVYAVASIAGDPRSRQRTPPDKDGGKNPTWNLTLRFTVPDHDPGSLMLHVLLRSKRILRDRNVGEVNVPVRELIDSYNTAAAAAAAAAEGRDGKKPAPAAHHLTYQVRKTTSGKAKGVLNISYKFSDLVTVAAPPVTQQVYYPPPMSLNSNEPTPAYPPPMSSKTGEPVTAYPAAASTAYPPPRGYPPPPQAGYAYPTQGGYRGYPPRPNVGYGAYPPPPLQGGYGYGYLPPAGPYGYGGAPPPQMVQQPAKRSKMGMGLGAGLLGGAIGGMLLGDMVSDAAAA